MSTLTPRQISQERLVTDMYSAGMRSVRINTAHLDGAGQLDEMARRLKSLQPGLRILIDTKGPEMRTTSVTAGDSITLTTGQRVCLEGADCDKPTTGHVIHVNYPDIHLGVGVDDEFLIDDGKIALRVVGVRQQTIEAVVTRGGELGSRKGIAVTGKDLPLPAVSDHDRMYISYACGSDCVDVVAHSFVRDASDVLAVKEVMAATGHSKPVIAKIENQRGIDNIAPIIAVADGILIARGDLTASIGSGAVPEAQAAIARAAKSARLPLYLATNILPSMMTATCPSDADIEGIHLAMEQGVDVMLLTNETAAGKHPVEAVKTLAFRSQKSEVRS